MKATANPRCSAHPQCDVLLALPRKWLCQACRRPLGLATLAPPDIPLSRIHGPRGRRPTINEQTWTAADWRILRP